MQTPPAVISRLPEEQPQMSCNRHENGCPSWCMQTTPHGVHQSALIDLPRGTARWTVCLGQIDGSKPHVNLIYLGVNPSADAHWPLSLADAAQYALFAARLGEAQLAASLTTVTELAATTAGGE